MATRVTAIPSTAATTPSERPAGDGDRWRRLSFAAISFVLGLSLLALAVPRTIAAWITLDAKPALDDVIHGRHPKPEDTATGIDGLKRAIAWIPSTRRLTNLATLEFERAWSLPVRDPSRQEALQKAERRFVDGLTLNPANGLAWLRLAIVREALQRPGRDVATCLVQSLDMAPNARNLWLVRARMLLFYWPAMSPDEQGSVRRQLLSIWTMEAGMRRPLVGMAREFNQLLFLQVALANDAEARAELVKILADPAK